MSDKNRRRIGTLSVLVALAGLIVLAMRSPGASTSAQSRRGSPLRLRLLVQKNTLRPGEVTKLSIEFLDSDYNQVPNDRPRQVLFSTTSTGSKGDAAEILPSRLTVEPGSSSGTVSLVARQAGRMIVTVSSEELDAARALVLISQSRASLIEKLEPVAHAEDDLLFERTDPLGITDAGASPVPANNTTPAQFSISFPESENDARILKITTDPNIRLLHRTIDENGSGRTQEKPGSLSIRVGRAGVLNGLNVFSKHEATVNISAELYPDSLTAHATVEFETPEPARIMFYEAPPTISPNTPPMWVRIGLGDQAKVRIKPTRPYHVVLTSPGESNIVRFLDEQSALTLSPDQPSIVRHFQMSAFPRRGKLELLAKDLDGRLSPETRALPIDSEIKKLVLSGPTKVAGGGKETEFTIRLQDKEGNAQVADWDREIDLSVNDGELVEKKVTILKEQGQAVVKWHIQGSNPSAILSAESFPLEAGRHEVKILFTPAYQLMLLALLGGVIGGIARQLHRGDKLKRIIPRWTGHDWDMGLVGRIFGSVVSGLVLYWAMKFGLARVTPDLGSLPVATFFGVIGGYAGLVVLDRLVEWCFKLLQWSLPWKKHAKGASAPPSTSLDLKTP